MPPERGIMRPHRPGDRDRWTAGVQALVRRRPIPSWRCSPGVQGRSGARATRTRGPPPAHAARCNGAHRDARRHRDLEPHERGQRRREPLAPDARTACSPHRPACAAARPRPPRPAGGCMPRPRSIATTLRACCAEPLVVRSPASTCRTARATRSTRSTRSTFRIVRHLSARCAAAACHALLRPAHAVRRQRPRQLA